MGQPAARMTDIHTCPMTTGPVPHVGGPIVSPASPMVLIANMPSAGLGSMAVCVGPPSSVMNGSPMVLMGNKPAARMGDPTAHGGTITLGCPLVLVG